LDASAWMAVTLALMSLTASSSASLLNGLGNDGGTEFFRQSRKRLGTAGVCDCNLDIVKCEGASERGTNLAGTNNRVFHKESRELIGCESLS